MSKWWAVGAIVLGIGLVLGGLRQSEDVTRGLDQLPVTILMIVGGMALIVAGIGYLIVRGFMAL